jgi:signal transduction histidine kinase/CheY-like chemotaxis protein
MSLTKAVPLNLKERVTQEQVRALYDSIASLVMINLVVSTALVYAFWGAVSPNWLLGWYVAMLAMLIVRVLIYASYKRRGDETKLKLYQRFVVFGSASAGVIWGGGGLIMFTPELEYQLFILLSLLAMAAGSAFSLSIYLPAYFAFVPLMLAPITLQLFLIDDSTHTALGSVTLVFLIAQTIFNIKINRSFTTTMSLRFENVDLIDQLKEQKVEAEQANRAKSAFLAAASHDLRQPLYALSLFTSALEHGSSAAKEKNVIKQIKHSAKSLETLFDALLDISKLDADTVDINKSDFELQPLLNKLAIEFDAQASDAGLAIIWEQNPPNVHSDPALLEQILRNFISNAIRYTNAGEITVTCEASADSQVVIAVSDTGIGILPAEQGAIFEEFYQLGNPGRDRSKGLGLGLSIVQRAAEKLKHKIEVVSETSQGSKFSIIVDKAFHTPIAVSESTELGESYEIVDRETRPLVVVIDDEHSIRDGLSELLSLWNYDVVKSADANGVITQLNAQQRVPDVIISDFRLEGDETGSDAIKAINKACKSDIRALIITGDTEPGLLSKLKSSGYEVLHKPVPPAKLRTFLRRLIYQSQEC